MRPDNAYGLPPAPTQPLYCTALAIGLTALAVLIGWRLLLTRIPVAEFAESSYQQNLLRIEALERQARTTATPDTVVAGTSIAGRLLPAYFSGTALADTANLGLDGTSPAFALEILLRQPQTPRRVLLESYLLHKGAATNEHLIRDSLDSPGARLARADRLFQTDSRPTTLLYAALKHGRESAAAGRPARNAAPYWTNVPAAGAIARLSRDIDALRKRGTEVILIDIPVGTDWPPGPNMGEPVASQLVTDLKLRRLDCRTALQARGFEPRFTDGIHLDGASAHEVAIVLAELATH